AQPPLVGRTARTCTSITVLFIAKGYQSDFEKQASRSNRERNAPATLWPRVSVLDPNLPIEIAICCPTLRDNDETRVGYPRRDHHLQCRCLGWRIFLH